MPTKDLDDSVIAARALLESIHSHFDGLVLGRPVKADIFAKLKYVAEYKYKDLINDPTPEKLLELVNNYNKVQSTMTQGFVNMPNGTSQLNSYLETIIAAKQNEISDTPLKFW